MGTSGLNRDGADVPDTALNQKNFSVSIGVYFRTLFVEARGERVDRARPHTAFSIALGQLAFRL